MLLHGGSSFPKGVRKSSSAFANAGCNTPDEVASQAAVEAGSQHVRQFQHPLKIAVLMNKVMCRSDESGVEVFC
jgi:hypothetical protein